MGRLSLQAMEGISIGGTLKIQGIMKRTEVIILLDSGSSYSFVDVKIAKLMKNRVVSKKAFTVIVTTGQKITSRKECKGVKWIMQNYQVCYDVKVI